MTISGDNFIFHGHALPYFERRIITPNYQTSTFILPTVKIGPDGITTEGNHHEELDAREDRRGRTPETFSCFSLSFENCFESALPVDYEQSDRRGDLIPSPSMGKDEGRGVRLIGSHAPLSLPFPIKGKGSKCDATTGLHFILCGRA
jgi:hypothetical protein